MRGALLALAFVAVGTANAAASHCHEVSNIVGYRHCSRFGWWSHSALRGILDHNLAFVVGRVGLPAVLAGDGIAYRSDGSSAPYHVALSGASRRPLTTVGTRTRWGYNGRHLTAGLEVGLGFVVDGPTTMTTLEGALPNGGSLAPASGTLGSGGTVFDVGSVVGLHQRIADAWSVGGEVFSGVRDIGVGASLPRGWTTCAPASTSRDCTPGLSNTSALVELRARADWFATPNLTIGLIAGVAVTSVGESLAAQVTFHCNAFDGS